MRGWVITIRNVTTFAKSCTSRARDWFVCGCWQGGRTALGLASRASMIGIVDLLITAERYQRSVRADKLANDLECSLDYHHCFYQTSCSALSAAHSNSCPVSTGLHYVLQLSYWLVSVSVIIYYAPDRREGAISVAFVRPSVFLSGLFLSVQSNQFVQSQMQFVQS